MEKEEFKRLLKEHGQVTIGINPFEHAVAYIKEHLEHWEIERGWAEIGKRMPMPSDTAEKIYCLLSDFSIDNDLADGWWEDYDAEEFFMEIEND